MRLKRKLHSRPHALIATRRQFAWRREDALLQGSDMGSPFRFKSTDTGFDVFYRGNLIGEILPAKEASGRHCFYLGCDDRREPRTYRGRVKAAEALQVIHSLTRKSRQRQWSAEKLIVLAWDERPRASDSP